MRRAVIILATLGILISGYSWFNHYGTNTESFCDISSTLSCSTVNRSIYSEFAGIPVAAIGFVGYALLLALALIKNWRMALAAGILGTIFSLYLTGIELFTLRAICILCVTSQLLILIITVTAGTLYFRRKIS